jgi:hypothetical protein
MKRWLLIAIAAYLAASVAIAIWLLPAGREQSPVTFAAPREKVEWPLTAVDPEQTRVEALRRARVRGAPFHAAGLDLSANPPDPAGTLSEPLVRCRYLDGPARGTTAKFDCVLPDGEVVKVKYGNTSEIQAELAASRLLTALGFGADRMFLIPRVRCYGCVRTPFYTNWILDTVGARERLARSVPEDSYTDFEWVSVERRFGGLPIETARGQGWSWFELDAVDPALGANRAERDAFRLAAMLIAHWDNKAQNQRLVCLAPLPSRAAPCPQPFALINDLGATFGPNKVDLESWKAAPIWADRRACSVTMKQFPYSGSTFSDTTISEAGRQLILRELSALSEAQVLSLFSGARFPAANRGNDAGNSQRAWAAAFQDKVQQIRDAGPCPPETIDPSKSRAD